MVVALAAVDTLWAWRIGFRFRDFGPELCVVGSLAATGWWYERAQKYPSIRDLGCYYALWFAYPVVWNIFTYLAATSWRLPLCDSQLCALDASLGFHWMNWAVPVYAHPVVKRMFFLAYDSIFLQAFAFVAYFAMTGQRERNRELLWITMVGGLVTIFIAAVAPALGPQSAHVPPWTRALLALRAGKVSSVGISDMQGIVAFPSFHTVLAVAFIYANRPPSRIFWPIAILNAVMLLSIPPMGHHYLTDVIAGTAVTVGAIAILRMVTARHESVAVSASNRAVVAEA